MPSDLVTNTWLVKQFEQIEQLQMLLLKQQSDLATALQQVHGESIVLLKKVRELEAAASGDVIPALEKAVNTVAQRAKVIDKKVPDLPPTTPPGSGGPKP